MKETVISHGLNYKSRAYLDELKDGKVSEDPYQCINDIYNGKHASYWVEINNKYDSGFYDKSYDGLRYYKITNLQ